jgi:putative ABC transport system ATP-binding protein
VEGVLTTLRDLADADRAVVIATHDERLLPLADRVVELSPRIAHAAKGEVNRSLEDGDVLFRQGEPGALVYTVESGLVQLVRQRDDGGEVVVGEVDAGAYFGELAPTFGLPRSATARAVGPTVVTGFPVGEVRSHLRAASVIGGSSRAELG